MIPVFIGGFLLGILYIYLGAWLVLLADKYDPEALDLFVQEQVVHALALILVWPVLLPGVLLVAWMSRRLAAKRTGSHDRQG